MTQRFGIDTSVLVRLTTGEPTDDFHYCLSQLRTLVEVEGAELFASNQVIGEAYVALQHHYGISKAEVRRALAIILRSGLVAPLNGRIVIEVLQASGGAGLLDRLIIDDYSRSGVEVLTLDRRMSMLPGARQL